MTREPRFRRRVVALAIVLTLAVALTAALLALRTPSNDRDWAADHAVPARVERDGERITLRDVRDFRHRDDGDYDEAYRDVAFHPDDVRGVWLVLAPFAQRWRGLAHTFLSFELTDDRFVAVSVEARREAQETYSLVGGMMRGFEVTYVLGTEEDVIGLRAIRGDSLYLYPGRATPAQARDLLLDVLERAEAVRVEPEFYHTLLNNCATNLRDHVNRLTSDPLPYGWGMLFPGYSDKAALEHGLLDTELSIDEARRRFRVDAVAREALDDGDAAFSRRIRRTAETPPES